MGTGGKNAPVKHPIKSLLEESKRPPIIVAATTIEHADHDTPRNQPAAERKRDSPRPDADE